MKKISLAGLALGALLGMAVALVFGKWLFWLGTGLVIGIFIGSVQARRASPHHGDVRQKISA